MEIKNLYAEFISRLCWLVVVGKGPGVPACALPSGTKGGLGAFGAVVLDKWPGSNTGYSSTGTN